MIFKTDFSRSTWAKWIWFCI